MNSPNDKFKLNNGVEIPCIGFGTWQAPDGQTAVDAVRYAVELGYRHIDTAAIYGNEKSVGKAIAESETDRKELFITTKLWNTERGYDTTLKAFEKSIQKLGLEYLDLYLIHWPANKENTEKINSDTWKAFEKLYKDGLIRSIGVSNFLPHHLQPLLDTAEIIPAVNQIEYHPGYTQSEAVEFCKSNNILIQAWSPLGSGRLLQDPGLTEIAEKYNKSVAQLCIKWCLQNDTLPLPKSVTPQRIAENIRIFDFTISETDMKVINQISDLGGSGLHPDKVDF
ncbi:MAG: aldo/keto reductase [Flavobacteriaceae bacterium]|jgi:diketogulonate reductase-like aldo/keto reductase|nr:aldo/keto reductase [Flavobacteriaceae bacterium]